MKFSKWLTFALSLCILGACVAIVWSFLSRRQQVVVLPETEILSPEISRKSTQFEYTEHKHGRPVFQVNAETSTQTVSNVHTLNEVNLGYFDEAEGPSDTITGRVATYRIDEKELEFEGNTQIRLADGTEFVSDQAAADLTREVAEINQGFQFKRGKIRGEGGSLSYSFPQREMRVADGLNLMTTIGGRQIQAIAREGIYRLAEPGIELLKDAGISSGNTQLKANQINLLLSPEYQILRILSTGQARLQVDPMKAFTGSRIMISFDSDSERLDQIEILGGPSSSAVYSQQVGVNQAVLEARKIVVVPDVTGIGERLSLKTFVALEEVLLRSPAQGINEAHSNELRGEFFEEGGNLRQVSLRGEVLVQGRTSETNETRLRSRALSLHFGPSEILEEARADGDVELTLSSAGDEKRLLAKDFVQVNYDEGVPDRIVSSGDCQLESITAEGRDRLQAPRVEMHFQKGVLENIVAETGVKIESLYQGKISHTTSDRLEVVYLEGLVHEVVQSGNFRFWEDEPGPLELQSDRAAFDPGTGRIVATGTELSLLRMGDEEDAGSESVIDTWARRFELDRGKGRVFAEGEVRSVLNEGGKATLITSGSMHADGDTGWVEYSVGPRIVQGPNSIHGESVRYNHREQKLIVETDVTSSFSGEGSPKGRRYSIESDSLVYNRQDSRVRYEGEVRLETQGLILMAPNLDLVFAETDAEQIQEIVAWGGVLIVQEGREAGGDRAVHHPVEGKVVLTGDPAQVIEAERGKVTGRRLTFYLGNEKILVEGHFASVTP
jgi:lipopolysaccharide export system protein LptA